MAKAVSFSVRSGRWVASVQEQGGEKDGTDLKEKGERCMHTVLLAAAAQGNLLCGQPQSVTVTFVLQTVWREHETKSLWPKSARADEMCISPLLFFCPQSRNLPKS